ncbi:MAG: HU family DNA-binding protein [Gammaproteobacteria bacterium]
MKALTRAALAAIFTGAGMTAVAAGKTEVIETVSVETGLAAAEVETVVDALLDDIARRLAAGEPVWLKGFGTFEVKVRAEREAKNPETGEALTIPRSKTPVFRADKDLKDRIGVSE